MLDQLVESKSSLAENRRKSGFLLTTFLVVTLTLLGALTYSLFAKDFTMNDGGLELSTLVAPIIEAERPSQPEPEVKPQPQTRTMTASVSNEVQRRDAVAAIEQTKIPPADLTGQSDVRAWVKGAKISSVNADPSTASPSELRGVSGNSGTGITLGDGGAAAEKEVEPPPAPLKPKVETKTEAPPIKKPVSGGIVNGKAINLVKPHYPPPARAVGAKGAVNVQVLIDEKGNVVSAVAVSGHQLLRQAAEQAARASKFTPTFLTNQPVKVTGVIVYNFTAP
jgi:periplasmic protein TonB